MRISSASHFSHPILSEETTDYNAGKFEVVISVDEDPVSNTLELECDVTLQEVDIEKFLLEGAAKIALFVHCGGTYHSSFHSLKEGKNIISFVPGSLSGRVQLRPIVHAGMSIKDFHSKNFNEEYEGAAFNLTKGDIIAWDREQVVQVGQKKLAPMDSIFEMARNEGVPEGEFQIKPDENKIQIHAAGRTYDHIHMLRGSAEGRSILLNSVYYPAVLQVLTYLQEGGGNEYEDLEWFQTFKAKCDFYHIDLSDSTEIVRDANRLLKTPYKKIMENFNNE